MILRDLPLAKADKILFDILTISTAVQTDSNELKRMIISGQRLHYPIEEIKEVVMNTQENSYGYLRHYELKNFKIDFEICKKFIEENVKTINNTNTK